MHAHGRTPPRSSGARAQRETASAHDKRGELEAGTHELGMGKQEARRLVEASLEAVLGCRCGSLFVSACVQWSLGSGESACECVFVVGKRDGKTRTNGPGPLPFKQIGSLSLFSLKSNGWGWSPAGSNEHRSHYFVHI